MAAATPRLGFIESAVTKLVAHEVSVVEAETLASGFRRLTLAGSGLRGRKWTPGDYVQVSLGSWAHRAYTPITFDATEGTIEIVVFAHGDGVGAAWGAAVAENDRVHLVGPRSALDLGVPGPTLFFGDESSFGTAAVLRGIDRRATFVFEVASQSESREVLERLGIDDAVLVPRERGDRHLVTVEYRVLEAFRTNGAIRGVFTGNAASIKHLYRALRDAGVSSRQLKNRAYWAAGKKGLD